RQRARGGRGAGDAAARGGSAGAAPGDAAGGARPPRGGAHHAAAALRPRPRRIRRRAGVRSRVSRRRRPHRRPGHRRAVRFDHGGAGRPGADRRQARQPRDRRGGKMKLDPITTEVVINRIRETTAAMAHALFHSGYSPILRESQDGTAGLCDADGKVIMVGGGLQYHSLLYTRAVESVRERYPIAEMRDGDSFISNDPYKAGNSHVPDVVVITPIFYGGKIIAFGASVAHKADVG